MFVLECLIKARSTLSTAVQTSLQQRLQRIYASHFTHAFEYPSFAQAKASIDADAGSPTDNASDSTVDAVADEEELVKRDRHDSERERGHAEVVQFLALRNKLRQCVKTLLLQTNSHSTSAWGASSKLD